jgi:hypothetical protein
VSTRVDHLAARVIYHTQLFDPIWGEQCSPRWDTEHIFENFWAQNRSFTHDLLCVGGVDVSKYWFMTTAEDWVEVMEYLCTCNGSNTVSTRSMSLQELSQLPFNVYFHVQRRGDLLIQPP